MKPIERAPSFAQSLVKKLSQAVTQGLALASLTVASSCVKSDDTQHEAAPDAGDDLDEVEPLQAYPLEPLGCRSTAMIDGFHGPCCVEAHCYTPEDGRACVAEPPLQTALYGLVPVPSGSGFCSCSLPDSTAQIAGPFAPNPEAEAPADECCYLVGKVGCTGRPLTVAGQAVIAALVSRSDWAPFA
jgi:hypothetical protein